MSTEYIDKDVFFIFKETREFKGLSSYLDYDYLLKIIGDNRQTIAEQKKNGNPKDNALKDMEAADKFLSEMEEASVKTKKSLDNKPAKTVHDMKHIMFSENVSGIMETDPMWLVWQFRPNMDDLENERARFAKLEKFIKYKDDLRKLDFVVEKFIEVLNNARESTMNGLKNAIEANKVEPAELWKRVVKNAVRILDNYDKKIYENDHGNIKKDECYWNEYQELEKYVQIRLPEDGDYGEDETNKFVEFLETNGVGERDKVSWDDSQEVYNIQFNEIVPKGHKYYDTKDEWIIYNMIGNTNLLLDSKSIDCGVD